MRFEEVMENIARGFEVVGVAVMVFGCLTALGKAMKHFGSLDAFFTEVRRDLGRPIILASRSW